MIPLHWRLAVTASLAVAACSQPGGSADVQEARVVLGRHLFYETRLSAEGNRSCGICHEQILGFTDGFVRAVGTTEEVHPRNTLTLTNVADREELTWLRDASDSLEEQLLVPLLGTHPVELGMEGRMEDVLEAFREDPVCPGLFAMAFPDVADPFHLDNIAVAIADFERQLVSRNSPYDRHLAGDDEALDDAAARGAELFSSDRLGCSRCHSGPDFDSPADEDGVVTARHGFFNTGLYNVDGEGAYPVGAEGLWRETGAPGDMGRFRTPTLRNLEVTHPYLHDGTGATLRDVLDNYARGGRLVTGGPFVGDGQASPHKDALVSGFSATEEELEDLEAFLRSLTDWGFLEDPAFADPWPDD